ncbi:MAG: exosortase T [Caulobacterales bacterium]|nr:exosortase T [Caulobacterales bacterium]
MLVALPRIDAGRAAFAAALLLLAYGPVHWLIDTWLDPAFDSHGFVYFALVVALSAWSCTSPLRGAVTREDERIAVALLAATALVRLAGQVLAIDTIGALALVIDVYALARLAGLERRARPLSPFWLSVAFAFALPLERIVQRSIGYVLQEISAGGACGALSVLFDDVRCAGVRISVDGADVLVDLPCSGARALIVFGFMFVTSATLARPRWFVGVLGVGVALAAALIGNFLRIVMLASGVAIGPARLGFDVMLQPWHDNVGLIALGAVGPALILWARTAWTAPRTPRAHVPRQPRKRSPWSAAAFMLLAVAIISAPRAPVDIARQPVSIAAPERIGASRAVALPLTTLERAYFEQFGGVAVKAAYGEHALMLARTTSPLRHLHAPDECLRGLGYEVTYLGMRFEPLPTARYRAVAPDGRAYRVDVSFLSDQGHRAASVSEAVWFWLNDRSTVWTAVQRISPEHASAAERASFDAGVIAALDVSTQQVFAEGGAHAR